jgi:hypothetical protein
MVRLLRRLGLASFLIGVLAFVARQRGRLGSGTGSGGTTEPSRDPAWPPIKNEARPFVQVESAGDAVNPAIADDGTVRWVPPADGQCPDGFPIKANNSSGIFHVPGGRSYDRTIPERCYAEADAAVADGYRAAKA